ncbi:MG2 domain-containing protein [Pontibacter sp. G13]|uniref:MG2 domain-containing protein n=1 Tax=Pontibacter sp. G13 TaxID=3074898 RepID=UPI00288A38A6|nr:MG2 domain-containing protein [Pontibacter sp. G13]WNJ16650.1 MG2 domain-containing protein [Pontibacter sp. G13]
MKRFPYLAIPLSLLLIAGTWFSLVGMHSPEQILGQFLRNLIQQAKEFQAHLPEERVYVSFDKPFYKPGETIWYSAMVRNGNDLTATDISGVVHITISDPKGSKVSEQELIIQDGMAEGDWDLPADAPGGLYTCTASTAWQENDPEPATFTKEFQVQAVQIPRLKMKLDYAREAYGPGAEVIADLDLQDNENQPLVSQPFHYTVSIDGQVVLNGSGQTDSEGLALVRFDLPEDLGSDDALLNVQFPYQGLTESIARSVPIVRDNLYLSFYPEGGELVRGMPGRVAVKGVNEHGQAADFTAVVENHLGEQVAEFSSYHMGMGAFDLRPEGTYSYHVRITEPKGISHTFALPKPLKRGWGLRVLEADEHRIRIQLQSSFEDKLHLVGMMRGEVYFASEYEVDPGVTEIDLDPTEFPTGVVQFTLFDGRGVARAERLAFVNADRAMQVEIETDKERYLPREEVNMTVSVSDYLGRPLPAQLSVAVTDDQILTFADDKSHNILSWLLMGADLRGDIQEPYFYFDKTEEKAVPARDLVMLTHGWRRFTWEEITADHLPGIKQIAEQREVSGLVLDAQGNPVPFASLKVLETGQSYEADSVGAYSIRDLDLYQPATLQAYFEDGAYRSQVVHEYGSDINFRKEYYFKGNISDEETGEALIGATVVFYGPNNEVVSGVATDFDGNFNISLAAPVSSFAVNYLGYETARFTDLSQNELQITMAPNTMVLEEVVVAGANRQRKSIKKMAKRQNRNIVAAAPGIPNDPQAGAGDAVQPARPTANNQPVVIPIDQAARPEMVEDEMAEVDEELLPPPPPPAEMVEANHVELRGARADNNAFFIDGVMAKELLVDAPAEDDFEIAEDIPEMEMDDEEEEVVHVVQSEDVEWQKVPRMDEFIFAEEEPRPLNLDEIRRNIGYPKVARDAGIEGTVVTRILIDKNGQYKKHKHVRTVHPILTSEIDKHIMSLKFSPAVQGGRPIQYWVNIPWAFKLLDGAPVLPVASLQAAAPTQTTRYYRARQFSGPDHAYTSEREARNDFRTTLYWNGRVNVPASGYTTLSFYTSDAISSFQITAEGISAQGDVGRGTQKIYSQLPVALTAKIPAEAMLRDTLMIPMTFHNHQHRGTKAKYTAVLSPGLMALGNVSGAIDLPARTSLSKYLPVVVTGRSGEASIYLSVQSKGHSDEMKQTIQLGDLGYPQSWTLAGTERNQVGMLDLTEAFPSSIKANFIAFPDVTGEIMTGLEGMLREPHGCFEQTSSSTYPNILVLQYLEATKQDKPGIRKRALGLIDKGYKRLTSFECGSGGYEWFGRGDGHEGLTAYGLLEFIDMQKVYPKVSQQMIDRTTEWLMSRRDGKGAFMRNSRALHSFGLTNNETMSLYITYALSEAGFTDLEKEVAYSARQAQQSRAPYELALAANTLMNFGRKDEAVQLLSILMQQQTEQPSLVHTASYRSAPGSSGISLTVEANALAAMAMMKAGDNQFRPLVKRLIAEIRAKKSGAGYYGSTNATVLALRSLIMFEEYDRRTETDGQILIKVNGETVKSISYEAGSNEPIVMKGLEEYLQPGSQRMEVVYADGNPLPYTLSVQYSQPKPVSQSACALDLKTELARSTAKMGETVRLSCSIQNLTDAAVPSPIAIIGIPGGLSAQPWQLKELVKEEQVDFLEVRGHEVILYFRHFMAGESRTIHFDLKAEAPGTYASPASNAYLYYTPEYRSWTRASDIVIGE